MRTATYPERSKISFVVFGVIVVMILTWFVGLFDEDSSKEKKVEKLTQQIQQEIAPEGEAFVLDLDRGDAIDIELSQEVLPTEIKTQSSSFKVSLSQHDGELLGSISASDKEVLNAYKKALRHYANADILKSTKQGFVFSVEDEEDFAVVYQLLNKPEPSFRYFF
ncbi:MAG: hypothetical protein PHT72_00820 [Candidatus Absconditabacteria bacterium]|nr:hypothetical protein [Candidatus Absconditabacteria bacterium]